MQQHRQQLVLPVVQPVEHAEPDIVDARLLAAMEAGGAPVVVALDRVGRVELLVSRPVVRLLEDLERADADFVENLQVLDGERGGVDVDAADADGRAGLRRLDLAVVARLDRLGV